MYLRIHEPMDTAQGLSPILLLIVSMSAFAKSGIQSPQSMNTFAATVISN